MTIIIDPELAKQIRRAHGPTEFRTQDGLLLGTFTPPVVPVPDVSDEEVRRRTEDPATKFYTFEEVMAKLRELS